MRRTWLTGFGLLVVAAMLSGCNNNLKDENALLTEENQSLREQLADRNAALQSAHDELRDQEQHAAELQRELETTRQSSQLTANMPADPFGNIPGVTGSVGAGEVTATLESDVLFDSGQATLKQAAKRSLDEVARVINNNYRGRPIRVAGHTDTDPIRKSGYKSNYHLGFERAYAVREYLISRGVPSSSIYIASHGPDRAQATKQQSRRVEIVVVVNGE
jgi:chemotaxis protein MotB